ncbi:hypothetical protein F4808DRAFT_465951 [Astrocystis sublimbata]|nr:hypothetical protein F4808DRAFT_465951 [Astrocystis sublimbata]
MAMKPVRNLAGSDDSGSESEWSDWEEEEHEENAVSRNNIAVSAEGDKVLPSIEQDDNTRFVRKHTVKETPDGLGTPLSSLEPEVQAPPARMSRGTRQAGEYASCKVMSSNIKPDSSQNQPLSSIIVGEVARVVASGEAQIDHREKERESLISPAPVIRPFADFVTPDASNSPEPELSDQFLRSLLRNSSDHEGRTRPKRAREAINSSQWHRTSTGLRGKGRQGEKSTKDTVGMVQHTTVATTSSLQAKTSQARVAVSPSFPSRSLAARETPAILRAENQRQNLRLAKPLAPIQVPSQPMPQRPPTPVVRRQVVPEIPPASFYGSSSGKTSRTGTGTGAGSTRRQSKSAAQPNLSSSNCAANTDISVSHGKHKSKGSQQSNTAPRPSLHVSQQPFPPFEKEPSLPPPQEIYRRARPARHRSPAHQAGCSYSQSLSIATSATRSQCGIDSKGKAVAHHNNASRKRVIGAFLDEWAQRASPLKRTKVVIEAKSCPRYQARMTSGKGKGVAGASTIIE